MNGFYIGFASGFCFTIVCEVIALVVACVKLDKKRKK